MARSTYPADSDVAALAATLTLPAGYSFTGMAAAAVDEWERRTGYHPFLGSGASSSRTYDPPGANRRRLGGFGTLGGARVLDLEGGLYALTSVAIAVTVDDPGLTLTQGTDFWPEPLNAPAIASPWQRLRFRNAVFGPEASVVVTGLFGYGATIPEDAWQAIARLGCALGLAALAEGLKTGAVRWAEETVSEAYDPLLLAQIGAGFRDWAEQVLVGYRRVGM